jgi:uncharacterized protein (DUF305 family)
MTTFDQQFIDMMLPHHLSAVEMAKIAADRGEHPEIKALAADIISAQEIEISQMREWRKDWFGSDQTSLPAGTTLLDRPEGCLRRGGA